MGFHYRRTKSKGPLRVSVGKRGVSASVGTKGFRVGITSSGKIRTTNSIPGTGISYTNTFGGKRRKEGKGVSTYSSPSSYQGNAQINYPVNKSITKSAVYILLSVLSAAFIIKHHWWILLIASFYWLLRGLCYLPINLNASIGSSTKDNNENIDQAKTCEAVEEIAPQPDKVGFDIKEQAYPSNIANRSVQLNQGFIYAYEVFADNEEVKKAQDKFIAFDVETTGLNPNFDKIVEIGAVVFENGVPIKTFDSLVNPNVSIPSSATSVNHITNEMIEAAPSEEAVYSDLVAFLENALDAQTLLCAHNAKFDMGFLSETLMRLGYNGKIKYIDTLKLSKRMVYGVENYKQQTLANYFGIVNYQEHRAASDARVCGEILLKLLDMKQEETKRKEQEIANVREQLGSLQNEFQNLQSQIPINPINNRVALESIKNLNNSDKGFDKGFSYWQQGESLRKAESIDEAIKLFDEARYNGYCAPALYVSYAKVYRKTKDSDNEIAILNEAIERFNDDIYICRDFAIRRNKVLNSLLKQKGKEKEAQLNEQRKLEKAAQKEATIKEPYKPKGRAVLKLSDELTLIEKYDTVASAARENEISPKSIRDAANGVTKHAAGFVWRYADDDNLTNNR